MRELLILLLIGGVAYLGYDDYSKRGALKQAQEEMQRLTAERAQVRQNPVRLNTYTPAAPTPPPWFQQRVQEGSSLDSARRHRQPTQNPSP